MEPYHYSGRQFPFFLLVIVTQFIMIKYSLLSIIVVGKKAAVTQFLVTAAVGYSLPYPGEKSAMESTRTGETKDYLSQLA